MKRSKMLFSSIFASFLAIAAFSGVMAAKNTQHIEKAEAATTSASGIRVFFDDQTNAGFTYNGGDPFVHMTSITFTSGSGYTSISQIKSDAFGASLTIGADYVDAKMSWSSGGTRPYELIVPWYINSFTGVFYAASSDRILCNKAGGARVSFSASIGNVYNTYAGSWSGCDWSGTTLYASISQTTSSSYTYNETTYSVTVSKSGTGTVSPSGTATYKKNQILSLSAIPGSGWSFSKWSDSGAQNHSVYVTGNVTYTATFIQIPALSTPVLSIDSSNNVTWTAVSNAQSYSVTVDGETSTYTTSQRSVAGILKPGTHTVSVVAKGDGVNYGDSASASKQYTVDNGFFVVGDFNSWNTSTFAGAVRMTSPETGKYTADVNLSANQKFEVVYATNDRVDWQNWGDLKTPHTADSSYPVQGQTGDAGKSVTVTKAGSYTVNVTFNDSKAYYEVIAKDYFDATFKLFVGSTEVSLTKTSEFVYTASNVSLTSGQVLTYKRNGTEVSVVSAKADATNNLESSRKVVANRASATVEVNVYDGTIYTNLGVAEGYHMLRSGVITTLTHNETPSDPSFIEYYSEAISFSANETIRFVDIKASGTTLPVVFDVLTINGGGLGDKFDNSTGVLKAKVAVTSAVYLKLKSGADEVYFGTTSEAEQKAEEFASAFNSAISAICDSQGGTTVSALRTAWQSQKTNFGKLLEASQNILKDATVEHPVVVIREFVKKYLYIAGKYSTQLGDGYNFLNKTIPNKANLISLAINDSGSTSTLLIGGIAVVIAGIAVGGYFLLRKKKEN